ncbi:MAG: hypothetical protein AMJ42_04640 [Deltaproteobacteria bacterium DG_8]|nr:MAG: hypothetical protein AMJ42_04640 [Deltaproteobacteria bacterium DG_8]
MFIRVVMIFRGTIYLMIMVLALGITFSCKKTEEKEQGIESENLSLPVINSVKILPEKPLSSDHLQAVVKPQVLTSGEYVYRWKRNGEEIMGETERTLKSEYFFKGDSIEVEVIPYQNEMEGKAKRSEPVAILNSPPVIRSASIAPSPAYSKDDLSAEVDVFDADGDYIRYTYQWKKGDEEILAETGSSLSNSHFRKGDKISYRVGVTDGEPDEVVLHSKESYILNSPPRITSQSSGYITEGSLYEYEVAADDQDGDPLTFRLSSAPEGMTIDSSTGMIRWKIREEQREMSYEFKIIVSDSEGAMAIQPITLSVSFR